MWEIKRANRPIYTVVSKGITMNGLLPVPAKAVIISYYIAPRPASNKPIMHSSFQESNRPLSYVILTNYYIKTGLELYIMFLGI
jgi:hypothetical protein